MAEICYISEFWRIYQENNLKIYSVAAPSNLDAAMKPRSAKIELQNPIEIYARISEIAAPKPNLDAKAKKKRF